MHLIVKVLDTKREDKLYVPNDKENSLNFVRFVSKRMPF